MSSGIRDVERVLGGAGDLLADDRAHRAAHEPEVHDADRDRRRRRWRRSPRRPRRASRSRAGRRQAGPGTPSGRRSRGRRPTAGRRRARPRSRRRGAGRSGPGRQAEVMAARRADPLVLLELLVEQHRRAGRALGPQVGRVDVPASAERRQLERHQTSLVRATARAARVIGSPGGRLSRHATNAAPAIDSAADVRTPPITTGRPTDGRPPGAGAPLGNRGRPTARRLSMRRRATAASRGRQSPPRSGTTGGSAAGHPASRRPSPRGRRVRRPGSHRPSRRAASRDSGRRRAPRLVAVAPERAGASPADVPSEVAGDASAARGG